MKSISISSEGLLDSPHVVVTKLIEELGMERDSAVDLVETLQKEAKNRRGSTAEISLSKISKVLRPDAGISEEVEELFADEPALCGSPSSPEDFRHGYSHGEEDGYQAGHDAGHQGGYESGYQDGYSAAVDDRTSSEQPPQVTASQPPEKFDAKQFAMTGAADLALANFALKTLKDTNIGPLVKASASHFLIHYFEDSI